MSLSVQNNLYISQSLIPLYVKMLQTTPAPPALQIIKFYELRYSFGTQGKILQMQRRVLQAAVLQLSLQHC